MQCVESFSNIMCEQSVKKEDKENNKIKNNNSKNKDAVD